MSVGVFFCVRIHAGKQTKVIKMFLLVIILDNGGIINKEFVMRADAQKFGAKVFRTWNNIAKVEIVRC
jgi:hypothetical protein